MGALRAGRRAPPRAPDPSLEPPGRPRRTRAAGRAVAGWVRGGIGVPARPPARPEAYPGRSRAWAPRRAIESPAVLLLAGVLAVAWFASAWSWPATHTVGAGGDSYAVTWYLGWAPFAIGHGMNPLVSPYVWAPQGINLMWNPMTLLALVMAPITVTAGVVVSFNVVATAAPALSAWAAYLAFRRWTRVVPALAGALCFGFSPFMAAQSYQHPFLTFLVTGPLLAILFDRMLVVQGAPAWRDGLWLGLVVWVQLLISEEILVMEAVAAGLAVVALCVANRQVTAARVRHALAGLGTGVLTAGLLGAAPLAFQFLGPYRLSGRVHSPGTYVTDLWNFVVPTRVTAISPPPAQALATQFTGNYTEWGAYIGVPLLAFMVLAIVVGRRRRVAWVGLAVAVGMGIASLGSVLHVAGAGTGFPLPWDLVSRLPLLQDVLPGRFTSLMFLGVGLVLAVGLDELWLRPLRLRAAGGALAALGLAALVPTLSYPSRPVPASAAFASGSVCPSRPGADVAVEPSQQEKTLFWQIQAGYCFSMPTGSGLIRPGMTDPPTWGVLTQASLAAQAWGPMPAITPELRATARAELARAKVTAVVIGPPAHPDLPVARDFLSRWLTGLLGTPPVPTGDALVWPHPSVATGPPPGSGTDLATSAGNQPASGPAPTPGNHSPAGPAISPAGPAISPTTGPVPASARGPGPAVTSS
ncbi:MAG: hypothetical protein ACRD0J_06545 [Acidimicrobiales bacterium]